VLIVMIPLTFCLVAKHGWHTTIGIYVILGALMIIGNKSKSHR